MLRVVFLLVLLLAAFISPAQAQDQRCFPETGQCISGRIREFWEQNGGLPVFGYPTTDQHEELIEGQPFQVQWFERNRLELHPENARPYDVLLGRLGVDRLEQQGRDWFAFPKGSEQSGCRHFAETGHTICGAFLNYFRTHGLDLSQPGITEAESLALFGMPISEAAEEVSPTDGQTYLTQHFERARMELHPENQPPFNVLLGLLGNEIREGGNSSPAPAPPAAAIVIQGQGDTVTDRVMLPSGRNRVISTHQGKRHFGIWAYLDDGSRDLVANDIGTVHAQRPLVASGGVYFEVSADGPWTITIEALQNDPAAAHGISGNGEYVSGLFTPVRLGPVPYNLSHTGKRNFAIWLRCEGGNDLIVNEIGAYTGSVIVDFERGPCFWDVTADGTWSATPR
jgi:hypothetical protein